MLRVLILCLAGLIFLPDEETITIFLIADSTVADKPYQGGNPEKGWGQVFPLYFEEEVVVDNHAVNGRSTKSFIDEGRWEKVRSLIDNGDYVFIEFGHNDSKKEDSSRYTDPDTAYRANLLKFVQETRARGGVPVLFTPIVRRRFDEQGNFYDTHGRYPEVVREVAAENDVILVDLHQLTTELLTAYGEEGSKQLFLHIAPGEYASLPEGRSDDTHLSANGAFRICDLVTEEIRMKIPGLAKHLKK